MAYIVRRATPHLIQPQYPVVLNSDYASYVSSVRLWSLAPGAPQEVARNNLGGFAKTGTIDVVPSRGGKGVKGDGSTGLYSRSISVYPQAMWIAVQFVASPPAASNKTIYSLCTGGAAGSFCRIAAGPSATILINLATGVGTSSGILKEGGPTVVAGQLYTVVAVFPSNLTADAYYYANGVKYNTDGSGSVDANFTSVDTYLNEAVGALKRSTPLSFSSDTVLFTARGLGQIPEALAKQISLNPYNALLQPQQRDAYVSVDGGVTISPDAGAITLTGFAPIITQPIAVSPDAGAITLTGYVPTIVQPITVSPDAGAVTFTGFAPTITQSASISPGVGAIIFTGFAPTILQPITVSPNVGAIEYTGFAPTITQSASVSPGVGSIVFTGFAPFISQPITVSPNVGAVEYVGFAPSITQTSGAITVSPLTGVITITGFSPAIIQSGAPAQQQILNALKTLLLAGSTIAGSSVFLHRVDPLQPDELPAIVIEEGDSLPPETIMVDGGQQRELDATVYCTLASSITASDDCKSFGLAAEKLIANDPILRNLCQFGVNLLESSTITNGEGDRLLAANQQKWRFAYYVHPHRPDIINPT